MDNAAVHNIAYQTVLSQYYAVDELIKSTF